MKSYKIIYYLKQYLNWISEYAILSQFSLVLDHNLILIYKVVCKGFPDRVVLMMLSFAMT